MKKIIGLAATGILVLALASCGGEKKDEKAFVSLDINPDIELIVDSDRKVIDFYAANNDAKVMLHGEDLKGMTLDAAISEVAKLSIDLGYMDDDNKVLEYTISSNMSSKKIGMIESSINGSFDKEAKKANLDIKCKMEPSFTLERKLLDLKERYKENKDIQALTFEKYKLVLAAMATDFTLKLEDAVKMDEMELIQIIEDGRDEAYNYATKAYNEAMAYADKAYNVAKSAFTTTAYSSYYIKNYKTHKVNYGMIYGTYQASHATLKGILKTSYLVESYSKKILSNEDVVKLVEKMKEAKLIASNEMEDLKDENGNITIDSINAYLDKKIKNIEDPDLQSSLLELTAELNGLEKNIEALIESLATEHEGEIKAIATSLKGVVLALSSIGVALIPDDIKAIVDEYKNELNELSDVLSAGINGEMTLDNMKDYIKIIEEKENKVLNRINSDLTKEEKEELEAILNKSDKAYNDAKETLKKALESAKAKSDLELDSLKKKLIK